jgi:peroxiredoxin Q/BCP
MQPFGIFGVLFSFKKGALEEGDDVSQLTLNDETGQPLTFDQFNGQWMVLYFYPKDNTPGCSAQAQTFSSMLDEFHEANAEVIGISTDSEESHQKFRDKKEVKVRLLTDPGGEIAQKFGVKIVFGMCARDTVLINPQGTIEKIFKGVNPKANPGEVLSYIQENN